MLTRYVNYVKLILVAFVTSTLKNKQYIYEPKNGCTRSATVNNKVNSHSRSYEKKDIKREFDPGSG